jgi:hypothetical protein
MAAEYQEKTWMQIIHGPVGVVAMLSSMLIHVRAHDYY